MDVRSEEQLQELSRIILKDFPLTSQILQVANSALYNQSGRSIPAVAHAVTLLGWETENILSDAAAPLVLAILACAQSTHGAAYVIGYTAVFSPIWVYAAVTAPFYLAADGVALFIPPKTYVIIH